MIEVTLSNGDSAEADTADEAMYAARILWEDAMESQHYAARLLTATIKVDGGLTVVIDRRTMLRYA